MDPVGICNLALGWVGAKRITALDDPSVAAELCSANFDAVRDAVLEARAWTFATQRFTIAADGAPPAFGYPYRHLLPAEVLRVLACDDGSDAWDLMWVREGQYILDELSGELFVRAIMRIEDVALWSPGFCQAVAYRLASVLVVPLSENRSLQADLVQLYVKALRDAAALDGSQGRSEVLRPSSRFRAARG